MASERALDRFLPSWDVREQHSIVVYAPPEATLAEVVRLTPRDAPLFAVLMGLRTLPWLFRHGGRIGLDRPLIQQFVRAGFTVLEDGTSELALGVVGRFWRPRGGVRAVAAEDFPRVTEPGWARAAVDFRVEKHGGRALLSTETRVSATDERARRRLGRYWRLVGPGSAAIRRTWLTAIKRKAERASAPG